VAGRAYLRAAVLAARGAGPYARMDDWMRPAVAHGLWLATAASTLILVVGLAAIRHATMTSSDGPAEAGRHTIHSGGIA